MVLLYRISVIVVLFCFWHPHLGVKAQDSIPVFPVMGTQEMSQDTNQTDDGRVKLDPPDYEDLPSQRFPETLFLDTNGNASVEDKRKWRATINMTRDVGCTGTLVGPRVLLTAAHCIYNLPRIAIWTGLEVVLGKCQPHPYYRQVGVGRFLDFGLCYLDREVRTVSIVFCVAAPSTHPDLKQLCDAPPLSVVYERLSIDPRHTQYLFYDKKSIALLLSGFGCSSRDQKILDGNLRAGIAVVTRRSNLRLTVGAPLRNDSPILCAGDSGGAAYRYFESDPYGKRLIVGVNSANIVAYNISFIAKTTTPAFVGFLRLWRQQWSDARICGIDKDIEHLCHE